MHLFIPEWLINGALYGIAGLIVLCIGIIVGFLIICAGVIRTIGKIF